MKKKKNNIKSTYFLNLLNLNRNFEKKNLKFKLLNFYFFHNK